MINTYVIKRVDRDIGVGQALAKLLKERARTTIRPNRITQPKIKVVAVIPRLLAPFGNNQYAVVEADVLLEEEF